MAYSGWLAVSTGRNKKIEDRVIPNITQELLRKIKPTPSINCPVRIHANPSMNLSIIIGILHFSN